MDTSNIKTVFIPLVKSEAVTTFPDMLSFEPKPVPAPVVSNDLNKVESLENETSDQINKNGKRSFKKYNPKRPKKQKVQKRPVYFEGCQPAMILNEYYKNLDFNFEVISTVPNKPRFTCSVNIKVDEESIGIEYVKSFKGEGMSKKDAKKDCCNKALSSLFPDSYKPPERVSLNEFEKEEFLDQKSINLKRLNELRRRISKLVNVKTIQIKAPSQILHELSVKISETGKCIEENGLILNKRFCFQIDNVQDESIVSLDKNEPSTLNAYGFGKSKKDAKNDASRQALKQFFNCDLDKILLEANLAQIKNLQNQQALQTNHITA